MKSEKPQFSKFSEEVIFWIKSIPLGKVATYGQIAKLAGNPRASRGVSWILHSCSKSHKLPWQRVLNGKGEVSFTAHSISYVRQRRLLEKEGVVFEGGRVDLKLFRWDGTI